ncbi:MAG: AMP-dependent synthetase/ligase [Fastidiosipilaceae bacterium]
MQKSMGKLSYPVREFTTLIEMLRQTAHDHGSRMAYMFRRKAGERVRYRTYDELLEDVEELGTGLLKYGLGGKKIALMGENSYEWAVSYLSIINGVGIVEPFDVKLPTDEVINLINQSRADVLIFSPKQLTKAREIADKTSVRYFICMDFMLPRHTQLPPFDDERFVMYSEVAKVGARALAEGERDFVDARIDVHAPAALIYTSGTTSMAKGVMLSMENICANVMAGAGSVYMRADERVLSVLPLHHTFETTAGMLIPLYFGACVCINDGLRYLASNLVEWNINVMVGVPLLIENIYKRVAEKIENSGKSTMVKIMRPVARTLSSAGFHANRRMFRSVIDGLGGGLRMIVVGAAAMDPQIIQAFLDFGIEFYQGYGLTEHAPIVSVGTAKNNVVGSVGPALDQVEVMIDQADSGVGNEGEILVRSKSVMLGYYENDEATAEAITPDGWLRTGDMGYIDAKESIHITGRSKSMIVLTNGKKAFPEEIEVYINLIPGVLESVVWGDDESLDSTSICAKLQIRRDEIPVDDKSDASISSFLKDHIRFINRKMPQYKAVKYFVFSEEDMIRTTTMKVKRFNEVDKLYDLLNANDLTMRTANGKNLDQLSQSKE